MKKKRATYNFFKSGRSFYHRGIFSGSVNGKTSPALIHFPSAFFKISSLKKTNIGDLKQWQIINQFHSLIQIHYAQIKRNPE
jgi:hypothetical protein